MEYNYSQLDKDNLSWFNNDKSRNTLVTFSISRGNIRGVYPTKTNFEYPITAFVGENGAGKSTLLSLIACAFHNSTQYIPPDRRRLHVKKTRNYYTYGDFFTFSQNETGLGEIEISSSFLTDNAKKTDIRKKKPSGKWNDYNTRPKRVVTYLGVNRIVPPSESAPHRHYCKQFNQLLLPAIKMDMIRDSMSKIFGKSYSCIKMYEHGTYNLFSAERNGIYYSGFNMGAGENVVLSILYELLTAGDGALFVIDEIELGLHAQAQSKFIEELKLYCKEHHSQVICSTHSKIILDSLPPEGRRFIKRADGRTDIIPRITSSYAFNKLSGAQSSNEIDVFVEDKMGEAFLIGLLTPSLRERIHIWPIGSDQAVLRQIAAHYREMKYNFIAFLDGDKRASKTDEIQKVKDYLETIYNHSESEFNLLMEKRIQYLPGNEWPEREIISTLYSSCASQDLSYLKDYWGESRNDLYEDLEQCLASNKHSEFYDLSKKVSIPVEQVRMDAIRQYAAMRPAEVKSVQMKLCALLG